MVKEPIKASNNIIIGGLGDMIAPTPRLICDFDIMNILIGSEPNPDVDHDCQTDPLIFINFENGTETVIKKNMELECIKDSVVNKDKQFLCSPDDRLISDCPEGLNRATCSFNRCYCAVGYMQDRLNCRKDRDYIDFNIELVTNQPISSRYNQTGIIDQQFKLENGAQIQVNQEFIGKDLKTSSKLL